MFQGILLAAIICIGYFVLTDKSEGTRRLRVVLKVVLGALVIGGVAMSFSGPDAIFVLSLIGAAYWIYKGYGKKS